MYNYETKDGVATMNLARACQPVSPVCCGERGSQKCWNVPAQYTGTVQVVGDSGNGVAVPLKSCRGDERFRGPNREQSHDSTGAIGIPSAVVPAVAPRCGMLLCQSMETYSAWLTENPQMASLERLSLARWRTRCHGGS